MGRTATVNIEEERVLIMEVWLSGFDQIFRTKKLKGIELPYHNG